MIKGVDLSEFQENVDYNALKNDGVEFAILRIGYGKDEGQRDSMFDEHYRGCKEAGIKVGAYHYSYCNDINNAIKEAENCINYLNGIELDLPVFYDLEDNSILNAGIDVTEIGLIFCNRIKQAGYDSGVYASLNWFDNYIDADALINEDFKIWFAQWNDTMDADFPVDIWQNTNSLEVGNICCDGDYLINESLLYNEPNPTPPEPTIDVNVYQSLAVDVIYGRYGNGDERKNALGEYYEEVQNIVNDMYEIIGG